MEYKIFAVFVMVVSVAVQCVAEDNIYISNANDNCLKCLCGAASGCNKDAGCDATFCGPFSMSHEYYLHATKNTSMDKSEEAFKQCALNYTCAERVVKHYLAEFARDCNGDGETDCTDYAMINFNGGYSCHLDLFRNDIGKAYAGRFLDCKHD